MFELRTERIFWMKLYLFWEILETFEPFTYKLLSEWLILVSDTQNYVFDPKLIVGKGEAEL